VSIRTKAQVRARIQTKLADTAAVIWSTAELDVYIQNGYDQFTRLTNTIWERKAIPDEVGFGVYDLPEGITSLERVTWDDYRIDSIPTDVFLFQDRMFEQQQGPVTNYMVDGDGFRKIRKIRVPSLAAATKFYVEYYRIGSKLVDTDTFEIPEHYVRAVVFFALGCARMRRGDGQDLKRAAAYMAKWQEVVDRANRRNQQVRKRMQPIVVGGGGRSIVRSRPPRPALPWNFGDVVPK